MNVDYNDAGKAVKTPAAPELSPEEQAMNAGNGEAAPAETSGEGSRRRPGCEGYVHVNENDAW